MCQCFDYRLITVTNPSLINPRAGHIDTMLGSTGIVPSSPSATNTTPGAGTASGIGIPEKDEFVIVKKGSGYRRLAVLLGGMHAHHTNIKRTFHSFADLVLYCLIHNNGCLCSRFGCCFNIIVTCLLCTFTALPSSTHGCFISLLVTIDMI
jgi:hypothetical protein